MNTLEFTTTIQCAGCVAKATPVLNKTAGENNWTVNTQTPDKRLTVTGGQASASAIVTALQEAGFSATPCN